ncbi:Eco57I restriction-modification methylase domain-containing protein [Halorubrum amylolyticum]|uniref:Eco57I restriction-modification methylase domain-containing protein n=1 Tax=Halorubrum amylolyticum TaxID=2508724 RepID=UPI0010088B35|nr:Eco57I restriction-modification methylase domain-containing protein [Halorubrum amylolyticum]
MKGHVPTPDDLAEKMVRRVFCDHPPDTGDSVLYPGAGTAPFAAAVERICETREWETPEGYGVEPNPDHLSEARDRRLKHVTFDERDFLAPEMLEEGPFEYVIGNPPYVPIEGLSEDEKKRYKDSFETASGRFDLYLLFFERALSLLAPDGVLSFITPEKFEYVGTAAPLRRLLTSGTYHVIEIEHVAEDAFSGLVTFPCVTTVQRGGSGKTTIRLRDGTTHETTLTTGDSWAPKIRNADFEAMQTGATLRDITERISPGIATGADHVFVFDKNEVPEEVDEKWLRPTVSGKQLREFDSPYTNSVFVCPYGDDGSLPDEDELGSFGEWAEGHRDRLAERSCVKKGGKRWYAWHETPPMEDILQPKIVFKDIAKEPRFWIEETGDVIPKHSVYYLIPRESVPFDGLLEYLNTPKARMWMEANCQRAHNGYYRLQSRVLGDLPVPAEWADTFQATL